MMRMALAPRSSQIRSNSVSQLIIPIAIVPVHNWERHNFETYMALLVAIPFKKFQIKFD